MADFVNWFEPEISSLLPELLLLLAMALVISSIGFYRTVYFISIGYAFSIVAMAIVTPLRHLDSLGWASALQNILLILWGLRLGIFLVQREYRSSYGKELESVRKRSAGMAWWIKIAIWLSVSILYVLMYSPALFGLVTEPMTASWILYLFLCLGLFIMGGGLVLEALSDKQKSEFKEQSPNEFCDAGLYRWVRCPNYLGEITFWVGNWIIGAMFYDTPMKWIASLAGLICIVLIMMGSTKRLEGSQEQRYGDQHKYQTYIRTVPVLFPFVPVYSLKNVRVFLE